MTVTLFSTARRHLAVVAALAASLQTFAVLAQDPGSPTVVRVGRLIDGVSAQPVADALIVIEETIKLMAERGTYWSPTLSNFTPTQALSGYPDDFVRRVMARHQEAFRAALRAGVKIVFGTDAGRVKHGTNAGEFALMVGLGMPPMQAIQSATSVAASLLRLEHTIGAIKAGLQADLIAVPGDPLADVKLLDVRFVMQAGKVIKSPAGTANVSRSLARAPFPPQ